MVGLVTTKVGGRHGVVCVSVAGGNFCMVINHLVSKKQDILPITLPNVNRFSEFFHHETQQ